MKVITSSGKRKSAIARATVKAGNGIVKINNKLLDFYEPKLSRLKLKEPLLLAGDLVHKVNINVNVVGGGISSQADASRLAIAKALVEYSKSGKLKEQFLNYDRNLIVADVRRKEPAKPNRHGQARAKRQKSYR
ncbi:30S ribosomal protein S9 [Candidatus Woesearchaeota archaeon]|nr:30S ribosomal protein S9 [Candidatus Woesearchaeota archaeon]|tara:strand:+ start:14936 stop:15337 length:402 start_codon:yes stop_codon:yes gene_type:complete